ncbi:hypothetical protein DFP72DRAFT_916481 [Ephemerocybe angulata]|uniref:Uncharacterized protein n=1 Tax=Ephemerocybe angulata TaxID=980116 RepID=A0A8H6HJT7_9AGAR|nr:hypothetical protein DFP72DRAFT_916481 [Tulosesus angulatus]
MSIPFSQGRPLPREILESIAYELVAQSPLGAPAPLIPLLLTNKAIYQALSMESGTPLYSHICRLKFDVGAVTRRAFTPGPRDLNGHLVQMCNLLRFIRSGDSSDEAELEAQLTLAYVAMLDNDGKNRAQLQHAGIVGFVDRFVRTRLNEGMEENDMWPQANVLNACALWLMWMFTTRESLQRETPAQKEEIIRLVFPYIACPYRYPSSLVPPNHYTLPLGKSNPVQNDLFTTKTPHGAYPLYHTSRTSPLVLCYYESNPTFIEPLIAPVAKLLYWSRREVNPFFRNSRLPATRSSPTTPGLTQEDLTDFNQHKAAKLPAPVVWDWERGGPVCPAEDGSMVAWPRDDESRKFDVDWWRARLCGDVFTKQPKWRLGSVYVRGMLSGLWQGIQFASDGAPMTELLSRADRSPEFSEENIIFSARPLIMRLHEHGFVRTPAASATSPIPLADPMEISIDISTSKEKPEKTDVPIDMSLANAWLPGPIGSLRWVERGEALDAGVMKDRFVGEAALANGDMSSTQFIVSTLPAHTGLPRRHALEMGGPVGPLAAMELGGKKHVRVCTYEKYDVGRKSCHERMVEAKEGSKWCRMEKDELSGEVVPVTHPGCLKCTEREAFLKSRRERDEIELRDSIFSLHRVEGGKGKGRERHAAEVESMFASVGLGSTKAEDTDEEEAEEEEELVDIDFDEVEEDDEPEGTVPPSRSVSRSPGAESGDEDSGVEETGEEEDGETDEDQDNEEGHPGVLDASGKYLNEPVRRSHDRYRVEQCGEGVEDVVITGGMDEQHRLAWGKNIYYGRVRPWDGLIAIMRISVNRDGEAEGYMIYYGYIYGGDTFVGNWRHAVGGLDPLTPGFECTFLMSRRSL